MDVSNIIKRVETIMTHYELSAASFADKIDVKRASISHLLNGRNKPSLEFINKVVVAYPEVNLYWILYGDGNFPSTENTNKVTKIKTPEINKPTVQKVRKETVLKQQSNLKSTSVERVIIFYSDGSFTTHCPSTEKV